MNELQLGFVLIQRRRIHPGAEQLLEEEWIRRNPPVDQQTTRDPLWVGCHSCCHRWSYGRRDDYWELLAPGLFPLGRSGRSGRSAGYKEHGACWLTRREHE